MLVGLVEGIDKQKETGRTKAAIKMLPIHSARPNYRSRHRQCSIISVDMVQVRPLCSARGQRVHKKKDGLGKTRR